MEPPRRIVVEKGSGTRKAPRGQTLDLKQIAKRLANSFVVIHHGNQGRFEQAETSQ